MQNNRNKHHRQRAGGLDGFLRSGPPPSELPRPQRGNYSRGYASEPQRSVRLDNFRRRDGYNSNNPLIGNTMPPQRQAPRQTAQVGAQPSIGFGPSSRQPSLRPRQSQLPETPAMNPRQAKLSAKAARKAQAKAKKGKPSKKKIFMRAAIVMVLILVLVPGFLFAKGMLKAKEVFQGDESGESAPSLQQDVNPSKLRGEGDGRVNLLVLGKGGPSHEGGELTDSMLIVSIDPIQKDAAILSVPRDLYVRVPEYGNMKINAVYNAGKENARADGVKDKRKIETAGVELTSKTLEESLGLPMHYHVVVDFDAFRKAIDTVGGVDIDVKKPVYDTNFAWQFGVLDVKAGMQHFDGTRALMYARTRYTSERGDFDRTERQREIMLALKQKVLSAGTYSNPLKVSQLIDAFGDHVYTDISLSEFKRMYQIAQTIDSSKIGSIGLADPPNNFVTTTMIGNQSVVIPRAGQNNYGEIQAYLRTSLRDSYLKNENASIMVLNGAGIPGLAGQKSEELKSFGYTVTKVADAPTANYTQTTIIDLTNGTKKYTRSYLEKRFNVVAGTALPDPGIQPNGAEFVIILGKNEKLSN